MRSLYISFILVLVSFTFSGQEYHKLINDSLYWDISYAQMGYFCSGYSENPPSRFSFSGDTMINNKQYAKSYYSKFITLTPPYNCGLFDVDTLFRLNHVDFLREDTVLQKVWCYDAGNNDEYLLFDFTYEQGDTIDIEGYPPNTVVDTVYYITTTDGVIRKKIVFGEDYYPGGYYIEGIGGAAGLFDYPLYYFESGYWLMCVKNKNDEIVMEIGDNCSDFLTNINYNQSNTIKIYPNPADYILHVQIPNSEIREYQIEVYDLFGRKVSELKMLKGKTVVDIDASGWKEGMYLLIFKGEGKIFGREKLVVGR